MTSSLKAFMAIASVPIARTGSTLVYPRRRGSRAAGVAAPGQCRQACPAYGVPRIPASDRPAPEAGTKEASFMRNSSYLAGIGFATAMVLAVAAPQAA